MEELYNYESEIIEDAKQYLASNGMLFKQSASKDTYSFVPAPVSLRPSMSISKNVYDELRRNQYYFNLLIEAMMKNIDKIYEILEPIVEVDPFIHSLIEVSKAVKESPYHQLGYMGILRTDYMISKDNTPKLVEMNTIASGLGSISDKMIGFYKYMMSKHFFWVQAFYI